MSYGIYEMPISESIPDSLPYFWLVFAIMTVCPHLANQLSPAPGMLLNIAALAVLILFGCHNPFMFNQSTLVLGYLLLYGYDVTGKSLR